MQFPKSLHANGWHARMPVRPPDPPMPLASHDAAAEDDSPHARRHFHIAAAIVAVAALLASAGLDIVDDKRPLDVQLSAAMHKAGETLKHWQEQLSRGLQVSLRAVADGKETPPPQAEPASATVLAQADATAAPVTSTSDRDQPVRPDVAPRQPQPSR